MRQLQKQFGGDTVKLHEFFSHNIAIDNVNNFEIFIDTLIAVLIELQRQILVKGYQLNTGLKWNVKYAVVYLQNMQNSCLFVTL